MPFDGVQFETSIIGFSTFVGWSKTGTSKMGHFCYRMAFIIACILSLVETFLSIPHLHLSTSFSAMMDYDIR
jgi:hypothetical protein